MSLGLLFLLARVNQLLRKTANWILYGSENSQLEILAKITDALGPVMDRERLREILVDELAATAPVSGIALFLKARDSRFAFQGQTGFDGQIPEDFSIVETGSLAAMLKIEGGVAENEKVQAALARADLTDGEHRLLSVPDVELWIPLISGDAMYGLLVLGCKPGEELYSVGDRQVWLIFAHQAGVAAHNLALAEDLRESRAELARAHQQLLYAREQERHQIACDLHDNAVQQLLGISYQVVALQQRLRRLEGNGAANLERIDPGLDALRQEILRVITQLRDLIGELRPPGLEEFGLGSALEGFVHKVQRQAGRSGPQIELTIDLNGTEIPEAVGICLFRVSQEALRNSLKHASAQRIQMQLSGSKEEVRLEIVDDGCGFYVPNRLSELTQTNHYGLVGIAERVDWVNGQLEIHSQPGQGTLILVRMPL